MKKIDVNPGRHVAVIGAGWAGCAAAVQLATAGHRVTLLEAARTPGGRARKLELNGLALDNGQHILLGAYAACLKLMRQVGVDPDQALLRLPLQMRYADADDGMNMVAARLPAPLHLLLGVLRAKGLARADKLALARFNSAARWMGWQLHNDCSVAELLERHDQTARLIDLLWRPLCLAALNTPPERASARVFLKVLGDSLGARRNASDMLLPRTDLGSLFAQKAADWLLQRGGEVIYGASATTLQRAGTQWHVALRHPAQNELRADAVVIATSSEQAAVLLESTGEPRDTASEPALLDANLAALHGLRFEAITTCYLQYGPEVRLPQPFLALRDSAERGPAQFVFDRGQTHATQAGLLAIVISAADLDVASDHESLTTAITGQLARALGLPALAQPLWSRVITDKRATFACTPDLARPACDSGLGGIWLAGDYVAADYPATLETAVRSGVGAAESAVTWLKTSST